MKTKNILAILLILCMTMMLFAACSADGAPVSTPSDSGSAPSGTGNAGDGGNDEITEINVWFPDIGGAGTGSKWSMVDEAVNALTEKEIGVHVNFNWVSISDIGTQFTLAMSNKEQVDVIVMIQDPESSFAGYTTQGMLMDISGYLEEYGQGILELMEPMNLLQAYTLADGGIYGIPTYRQLNTNYYLGYRIDILEEVGMLEHAKNMKTWDDVEVLFQAIVDNADTYAIGGQGYIIGHGYVLGKENLSDSYSYDVLGDKTRLIFSDQDGNISNVYENAEFIDNLKMVRDWYDSGWLYPDSYLTTAEPETMVASKLMAGYLIGSEYGVEVNKAQSIGTDMLCLPIINGMISTTATQNLGVGVPISSGEPEAAIKFLNLCYTSSELMTLLDWGIEGETFLYNDKGEATYPEGTSMQDCGYHQLDFLFGNQFLVPPWDGSGADFRELAHADFLAAPASVYMGLSVDLTGSDTLVSNLSAVRDEYWYQINGGLYTDALLSEFLEKLDAAGVDDYIAMYQNAVNEFTE